MCGAWAACSCQALGPASTLAVPRPAKCRSLSIGAVAFITAPSAPHPAPFAAAVPHSSPTFDCFFIFNLFSDLATVEIGAKGFSEIRKGVFGLCQNIDAFISRISIYQGKKQNKGSSRGVLCCLEYALLERQRLHRAQCVNTCEVVFFAEL